MFSERNTNLDSDKNIMETLYQRCKKTLPACNVTRTFFQRFKKTFLEPLENLTFLRS